MENISNLRLFCSATSTKIDNGPDIYVGVNSRLKLVCRINTGGIPLNYVIWRQGDKVGKYIFVRKRKNENAKMFFQSSEVLAYIFALDWLSNPLQIAKFLGGESKQLFLEKDVFLSKLAQMRSCVGHQINCRYLLKTAQFQFPKFQVNFKTKTNTSIKLWEKGEQPCCWDVYALVLSLKLFRLLYLVSLTRITKVRLKFRESEGQMIWNL